MPSDDLVKAAYDALRWQGEIHIDAQRFPIKIVDHVEQRDTPAVAQLVPTTTFRLQTISITDSGQRHF